MGIATVSIIIVQLISICFYWSMLPPLLRALGFVIGLAGDVLFLTSVITMADSWRVGIPSGDSPHLVTRGIYSYSRNPAFLAFDLQYLGLLLMFFNPISLLFTLFASFMLHLQILQEEAFLSSRFGKEYEEYKKRVMRYLGKRKER